MLPLKAFGILCVLVLLGSCAGPQLPSTASFFQPPADQARIFFYVSYDDPDDKPFFPETFALNLSGFAGDIRDDQFIQFSIAPGVYDCMPTKSIGAVM